MTYKSSIDKLIAQIDQIVKYLNTWAIDINMNISKGTNLQM